jgi:alkyl hydroperoxide reductase subunit F
MYDLVIVGGGPAGLTTAIYAIRKRLNVLVVSMDLGGKTNYHLELPDNEGYQVIRGVEVVNRFKSELEYLKFAWRKDKVKSVTKQDSHFVITTGDDEVLEAKAVVIATGARMQKLNVTGEDTYLSRGLCYSAVSYAPQFIDKKTVVIGDGELALRSTAELATVAEHVHLIGPTKHILDSPLGKKIRAAKNVTILEGYQVSTILGNGYAERVVVRDPRGEEIDIPADGMFIERDLIANSAMVKDLAELDDKGFVKVDCYNRTSVPGLFAAGDVTNIYAEQVLVAVGEGVKAALSAYDYLLPLL